MRRTLLAVLGCALALRLAPAGSAGPDEAGAPPDALRIVLERLDRDTLVTVDAKAIRALAPAWRISDLRVSRGSNRSVPVVERAGPDAPLAFLAEGADGRSAVFEIRPPVPGGPPAPPPHAAIVDDGEIAVERHEWRLDRLFGEVAAWNPEVYDRPVPTWYLAALPRGRSVDLPVGLPAPGAVADATVTVKVDVVGTHEGPVTLAARWGERDLGEATVATAAGGATLTWTCRGADAAAGAGPLRLTDRTGALPRAPADDVSDRRGLVGVAGVVGAAPPRARGGRGWGRAGGGGRAPLSTLDAGPLLRAHRDPPDPLAAARGADMVIVATQALLPGARRLAEHRAKGGIRAVVVPARDVWDRVNVGEATPGALRSYLRALDEGGAGPRFVLLCGDALHDRGDLARAIGGAETIPAPMARTKYNGATPSDALLVVPEGRVAGGAAIGRIPFRDPKDLEAYVDRVIRYETAPPADASRKTLRFVTSEGRFGPLIDPIIESVFTGIVADPANIPYAYDVEVTFASLKSPYCWPPPEFNDKVIGGLNEGALFYTYVGHGHAGGFDFLQGEGGKRHPILRSEDAPSVSAKGTPPVLFVVACTTAIYDLPDRDGVGETLLKRPEGPVAYWGATRVCHPLWNSVVGGRLASGMFADPSRRLGEIVSRATREAAEGSVDLQTSMAAALFGLASELPRLRAEGARMYGLLGDPALKVAFPADDLSVTAVPSADGAEIAVKVSGAIPDGTDVRAAVEVKRNVSLNAPEPVAGAADPAGVMRANHARSNDKAIWRGEGRASGGSVSFTVPVPEGRRHDVLSAKAFAVYGNDAHVGGVTLAAR